MKRQVLYPQLLKLRSCRKLWWAAAWRVLWVIIFITSTFHPTQLKAAPLPDDPPPAPGNYSPQAPENTTRLVSTNDRGSPGWGDDPAVSQGGTFVAYFTSDDQIPSDTNGYGDIYVYNRLTGQTEVASVSSEGAPGNNYSEKPAISSDGRTVAFLSSASNLTGASSRQGPWNVIVHDRQTGRTVLVSRSGDVALGSYNYDYPPSLSTNGRYVAFTSDNPSLVSGDSNGTLDVFVADRDSNGNGVFDETNDLKIVLVSRSSSGVQGRMVSCSPSISGDGRFVAFQSEADNLVRDFPGGWRHVYLHDRDTDNDGIFDEAGAIDTTLLSRPLGGVAADGYSMASSISANGAFIAYESTDTHLVSGDTNDKSDIFVYERSSGTITRASVLTGGAQADMGSTDAHLSSDGRWVLFEGEAANLIPDNARCYNDSGRCMAVLLHDRQNNTTKIVSNQPIPQIGSYRGYFNQPALSPEGSYAAYSFYLSSCVGVCYGMGIGMLRLQNLGSGTDMLVSIDEVGLDNIRSQGSSFTPDGSKVAYVSDWPGVVMTDTNGVSDVFAKRLSDGQVELGSLGAGDGQANAESLQPAFSKDGNYLAFQSAGSNLVPNDTNGVADIFVRDLTGGATWRLSVDSDGNQANGASSHPSLSWDGRFIAFQSNAANLVTGDTNNQSDIFVVDRDPDQDGNFDEPGDFHTVRVSISNAGVQADNASQLARISADGRFVAFNSNASNLVSGDTNGYWDVFVHDRDADGDGVFDEPGAVSTERVSVSSQGAQGNANSGFNQFPALSADGRFVAFTSDAKNLVLGDTGYSDIFLHDRRTAKTTRISAGAGGVQLNSDSDSPTISVHGRYIAFHSRASNLLPTKPLSYDGTYIYDQALGVMERAGSNAAQPAIAADGRSLIYTASGSDNKNYVYLYNRFAALSAWWLRPDHQLIHAQTWLEWALEEIDEDGVTADLQARAEQGGVTPIASGQPSLGSLNWDTGAVPDGVYNLDLTFTRSGQFISQASRRVVVGNDLHWISGTLSANQNWGAEVVHVVESDAVIPSGIVVTVQPGAVIKFFPGVSLTVQAGGALTANGASGQPIVFTSLNDDTSGGDLLQDGDAIPPQPGDWTGVGVQGNGQFNYNSYTELRFLRFTHSGALSADEVWGAHGVHYVSDDVTIPGSLTLVINPGAIVKFAAKKSLIVQPGGRLQALGSLVQPIVFTSYRDDSAGGDTDGDGGIYPPQAGDWHRINLAGGAADFDHAVFRYGGGSPTGSWDKTGAIRLDSGSVMRLNNSRIEDTTFEGIVAYPDNDLITPGPSAVITNTVIARTDRGVTAHTTSQLRLVNCTLFDNRIGIWGHGGRVELINSIVLASTEAGISHVAGPNFILRYNDVWSSSGNDYTGMTDPTGTNGNISEDPGLKNPANGDYRLSYLSPAIDAADGAHAPASDAAGAPRYDDPRTANTGAGSPPYADMGAYEFIETASSDIDLVVSNVTGPSQALVGDTAIIHWSVTNMGTAPAIGPWHDRISLSIAAQDAQNQTSVATVAVGQGVALGPGQNLEVSAEVRIPGAAQGIYTWSVKTNVFGEVFEGQSEINNEAWSARSLSLDLLDLVVDGSPLMGRFNTQAADHWFKLIPPAGEDVLVSLMSSGSEGSSVLYIGMGYVPDADHYLARSEPPASLHTVVYLPSTSTQTYYVLAHADSLSGGAADFTLCAASADFALTSVEPEQPGDNGSVTFRLRGGKLTADMTYELIDSSGNAHTAQQVYWMNSTQVFATFDMNEVPSGVATLQAHRGSQVAALPGAVRVTSGGLSGQIDFTIQAPSVVRAGATAPISVIYKNIGNTDVPVPLVNLGASGGSISPLQASCDPNTPSANCPLSYGIRASDFTTQTPFLALNMLAPVGTLPPGASGRVDGWLRTPLEQDSMRLDLHVDRNPQSLIDWHSVKEVLKPDWTPSAAWDVVFNQFVNNVGSSESQFRQAMIQNAQYLAGLGILTNDLSRLATFELERAGLTEIGERYTMGAFGYGGIAGWEVRANTRSNGDIWVGSYRPISYFSLLEDGTYQAGPGDQARLWKQEEEFFYQEIDGILSHFRNDGKLDYTEDLNGNRQTLEYSGNQVVGIRDSTGYRLDIQYNEFGRVSQIRDSLGKVTSYGYDAAGLHLTSVTAAGGTIGYSYITGQGATREHAVSSITLPSGSHIFLEYDSHGRLARSYAEGGAMPMDYSYGIGFTVLISTPLGITRMEGADFGRLARLTDPLGQVTSFSYNDQHQLTGVSQPLGVQYGLQHDQNGNPLTLIGPQNTRLELRFSSPIRRLVSVGDPNGNTTRFNYDEHSNLSEILLPDGSRELFNHDADGNLSQWVGRSGQKVNISYNSYHLPIARSYDGVNDTFTYDAALNLSQVARIAPGINRVNKFNYDDNDQLVLATDPFNRSLSYTYANHRLSRIIYSDGYAIDYGYDTIGRLSTVSDANGPLATYHYDLAGNLSRVDKGNGAYSIYIYDAVGRLVTLVNHAPDGTVSSRFDITYDALGRRISTTSLDGRWEYTYDAKSQLTRSVFTSNNPNIPAQDLLYEYDLAGNILHVTRNGVSQDYTVNQLNQYTHIGSATYQYNADGALISKQQEGQTWNYSYDSTGHLIAATTPEGSWSYEYDALGRRIAEVHNGQRIEFLTSSSGSANVVASYAPGRSEHYIYGIGLVAAVGEGGRSFFDFDAVGNVAALVNSSGLVLNRYAYTPFGEQLLSTGSQPNPFTFSGQFGVVSGPTAGMYYMKNRWYDAFQGRFTQPDPIILSGGDANAYRYTGNHPTDGVDPSGLCTFNISQITYFKNGVDNFDLNDLLLNLGMLQIQEESGRRAEAYGRTLKPLPVTGVTEVGGRVMQMVSGGDTVLTEVGEKVVVVGKRAVIHPPSGKIPGGVDIMPEVKEEVTRKVLRKVPNALGNRILNAAGFFVRAAGWAAIVYEAGQVVCWLESLGNNPKPVDIFNPDRLRDAWKIQASWVRDDVIWIKVIRSTDPNLKLTNGKGVQGFTNLAEPLEYTILFENKADATAPAQKVVIEDNLDWQLDTSTLELVAYGFNRQNRRVLPGQAQVDAYVSVDTDPNPVHVQGGLETGGKLRLVIESQDADTLQPPEDPLAGFLPPNDALQRGEGFVTFRIRPKSGLADGTQIFNQAGITFDVNQAINTPVVTNTLDLGAPTATVNPLPAESHSPFVVSWSGSDGEHGSGVASFDLYVSEDGGAYHLWLASMQNISATFNGVAGRKYDFFAVATDAVGNRTPAAFTAQAGTRVTQGSWQLHLPLVSRKLAATRH